MHPLVSFLAAVVTTITLATMTIAQSTSMMTAWADNFTGANDDDITGTMTMTGLML
jgi:hypothetical protein